MNIHIKSFLPQTCIGYSKDFGVTYLEAQAIMSDGTKQTMWGTAYKGNHATWQDTPVYPEVTVPNLETV